MKQAQEYVILGSRDLLHALTAVRAVKPSQDDTKVITISRHEDTRSSQANRRYWALLQHIAEQLTPEGRGYSADTWHEYFKAKFLGVEEVNLPNKRTFRRPLSSADLSVSKFCAYSEQVEAWAAEHGVTLPELEET